MKNKFVFLIASIFLFAFAEVNAQTQVVNLTTGSAGSVADPDPIWTQVTIPGGTVLTPFISNGILEDPLQGPYGANPCGRWISPHMNTDPSSPLFGRILLGSISGSYVYQMTFDNPNKTCPASEVTLNLDLAGADNDLRYININGTVFNVDPGAFGYNPLQPFSIPIPPNLILPGLNTIKATVINAGAYTGIFICGNLTIEYDEFWNKTTANALSGGDIGNDIITDASGDIYVAGTFLQHTEFLHPSCGALVLTGDANPSAYIAKYSKCGTLLWVNYDVGTGFSRGTGLAYDSQRNLVYMAGTEGGSGASPNIAFYTGAASPCVAPTNTVSSSVGTFYIAKFNAGTGSFIDIHHQTISAAVSVKPNVSIDLKNVTTNTTDLFATLAYTGSTDDYITVRNIHEVAGTYTTPWTTNSTNVLAAGNKTVNDIVIDPVSSRVYITGAFSNTITFGPALLTTSIADAYVYEFNSTTGAALLCKKLNVAGAAGNAEGTGIAVGSSGIYITGFFNSDVTGVFGSALNFSGGLPGFRSYVVSIATGLSVNWVREIRGTSGSAIRATGIAYSGLQNKLVITGTLTGNITSPATMVPNGTYSSFTAGAPKMFNACFSTSGPGLWANATADNVANSNHTSTKIAAFNDRSYSTGGYTNKMSFPFAGPPPASGALIATPVGIGNTFVVRNNMTSGVFFKTSATAIDGVEEHSTAEKEVSVFPNPSEGTFTVDLGTAAVTGSETIEVFDLLGKSVLKRNASPEKIRYDIDLSSQPKGIYIVKIKADNKEETMQIQLR
jgi:hypothetical protein